MTSSGALKIGSYFFTNPKLVSRARFYVLVVLVMVPFVLPFIWMLMNSFKNQRDLLAIPPVLIFAPILDNYRMILSTTQLPLYFVNSVIVAVGSTSLALLVGLPSAFVIARFNQTRLANAILLARILPQVSALLPWYVAFVLLHLTDTYPAMILTHTGIALPLTIWIMISFYEDLPKGILDAAFIDGCSLSGAFVKIALPLSLPGIAVATILSLATSWNNFMLSFVVSGPNTATLPVLAYSQIAADRINFGGMAASGIVLTAPILIFTLFVQRYLIRGLTLGSGES
jgi:multiple sugar transport system permease protein